MTTDQLQREIYTVSRLNKEVQALLSGSFSQIWLQGEISNFTAHSSGHWYFSLKDASAQVSCAMFRGRNAGVSFRPEAGMEILVRAKVTLYEPNGRYQLLVEYMEPAGEGALRQAFEALKLKLSKEGLFATEHKQPVPDMPSSVAVITSPTGAAIRDVLSVLKRRYPLLHVIVYPVKVQGEGAAEEIVKAIALANTRQDAEVILLARGGGSIEDLWAFNEEIVARAVFESTLPVVSGIGHEIDFTIADFVADYRTPTPSAAAEAISPDRLELLQLIRHHEKTIHQQFLQRHQHANQKLEALANRLQQQHPVTRIQQMFQRTDELNTRMGLLIQARLQHQATHLNAAINRLLQFNPQQKLRINRTQLDNLLSRLRAAIRHSLLQSRQQLASITRTLDSVSPLATLERGYSIISRADNGQLVTDSARTKKGDLLVARLASGELECEVTKTRPAEKPAKTPGKSPK